ncbi:hypothetical protein P9D39_24465 [Heyndrickxia oleronia]|uniref:Phage protein n=1 Tax=Heyndrickxia oleronia TaxID=38875 RepID=A0A8E2I7M5_9BACI|nr:replication-relaxation family protein [Heyndrickxia oleronia]MEC1377384.1 hypothetical protein [Heyndrickxia oleronia]OOP67548.1 hypothetical protein BWZ43_15200 [Heyndrickxia oleronia]QQZ06023.1 hypothetical protein I5818_06090 [Heyndrickxia oleronia]
MLLSTQSRIENLLTTIDQLGMVTIRQLRQKHDLKSYRNACRVINQLDPYIHTTFFNKEKVLYLNKDGREFVGSTKEVKRNALIEHILLSNEVYFHFKCPLDWQREHVFELEAQMKKHEIIVNGGLKIANKKIIADASFTRNGYIHFIEIDNTRDMSDNKKKIESYIDVLKQIRLSTLYIFTKSNIRKRKFESLIKQNNLRAYVHTFDEIK